MPSSPKRRYKNVGRRAASAGVYAATQAAASSGQEELFQMEKRQHGVTLATKGGQKKRKTGKTKQTLPVTPPPVRFVINDYFSKNMASLKTKNNIIYYKGCSGTNY